MTLLIGSCLVVYVTAVLLACVVCYHVKSHGDWRRTDIGKHVMSFMAALAATMSLASISIVAQELGYPRDPTWFQVLRLLVFLGVVITATQRLKVILWPSRDRSLLP